MLSIRMSVPRQPTELERTSPPRLYVVPASPLEFDDGRETMLSAIRRRWRRALLGGAAGAAMGLAAVWWTGERMVYTAALGLGQTIAYQGGQLEIEPVQDALTAREAIIDRLRAAAPDEASRLAQDIELTPASTHPDDRTLMLWMRLRTAEPLDTVEQAFGRAAAAAIEAQAVDFSASVARQRSAVAVAQQSAEAASLLLARIRDGQMQAAVSLSDLIRLTAEASLLEEAAKSAVPARIEGPILVAPQPAATARAVATIAWPSLLLALLASTPWRRRPAAR